MLKRFFILVAVLWAILWIGLGSVDADDLVVISCLGLGGLGIWWGLYWVFTGE